MARKLLPKADIRILRHNKTSVVPDYSNGCFYTINEVREFAPQIAVIANPASLHMEIALKLTENGTHLLIEKPIAASLEK